MKIERISKTDYFIYLFHYDFNKDLMEEIKKKLKQIQKRYHLKGYYKVVIIEKNIGIFLKLILIDSSSYQDTLNFRFVFIDENIYYKTKEYDVINNHLEILYQGEYYYILVDSINNVLPLIEYGRFVLK